MNCCVLMGGIVLQDFYTLEQALLAEPLRTHQAAEAQSENDQKRFKNAFHARLRLDRCLIDFVDGKRDFLNAGFAHEIQNIDDAAVGGFPVA